MRLINIHATSSADARNKISKISIIFVGKDRNKTIDDPQSMMLSEKLEIDLSYQWSMCPSSDSLEIYERSVGFIFKPFKLICLEVSK